MDHVVIDVNGIGYMIYLSGLSMEQLPMIGSEIKVHTYLYLREDLMMLYGFLDRDELEMFKLLLGVSGIGPKGAMAILSTLSADDLRFAILSGDSKTISKAPGVGGKTAQRVVLELKDKFKSQAPSVYTGEAEAAGVVSASKNCEEAVSALEMLGYARSEASAVVAKLDSALPTETLIKQALRALAKQL